MLTVIILTICALWCVVSIAVGIVIGAVVKRRDTEVEFADHVEMRSSHPETSTVAISQVSSTTHARP